MLRISLRLVHGQTGPRRVSAHTPAEVVAQGGDTERVVVLADNLIDQFACVVSSLVAMTVGLRHRSCRRCSSPARWCVSGLAATLFGPRLERSARRTVAARAAFATALVSSLSAARTVKLAGATRPVLAHLARLDRDRSDRQRREISIQVWARSTPSHRAAACCRSPPGRCTCPAACRPAATLVAVVDARRGPLVRLDHGVAGLAAARRPGCGPAARSRWPASATYSAAVPGVDISAGTAPAPPTAPRNPLRRLELAGFTAVHEDGTVGVRGRRPDRRPWTSWCWWSARSARASRRCCGRWPGSCTTPARCAGTASRSPSRRCSCAPTRSATSAQLPRVLSGTVADNIRLGHEVDAASAVSTAQLDHDLAAAGGGLGLLIGHKGTRLSGGQLQRLALARALAPRHRAADRRRRLVRARRDHRAGPVAGAARARA